MRQPPAGQLQPTSCSHLLTIGNRQINRGVAHPLFNASRYDVSFSNFFSRFNLGATRREMTASLDRVTTDRRSYIMSRVPSTGSSPELIVRKLLHRAGLRYRLHAKNLPGRPDIVLVTLRLAIFVHGCFWHGHQDCPKGRLPKSKLEYWGPKITANRERDRRVVESLNQQDWNVELIWQCETKDRVALTKRLSFLVGRKIADE